MRPLRTADDVMASHRQSTEQPADAQISVARYAGRVLVGDAPGGRWFAGPPDAMRQRSQDLPEPYGPTGAVWWARTDARRRAGTFHLAGPDRLEIDWTRAIDIDTEDDWRLADALMGRT